MTPDGTSAPGGVVTFVFTDIEGSTRLFHRLGQKYVRLIDRHNEILRDVWKKTGGYEVSTEGDSFFVAFSNALSAVEACASAQRRLASEYWPDDSRVRVRMAVHTGLASLHGGDYVSLAVHQASRLLSAAHGEQILVSGATAETLGSLEGLGLRLLGRYRLRSFDEPQNVYQLTGDGLRDEFPAVRAVPAQGHNIARRPTPTIGRDEMVAAIAGRVQPGRLLTLLGPGGVGKTRVAEEVGMKVAPAWPDGVWLVNLADVSEPDLVPSAIADAVGAPNRPGRDRRDDMVEHLRDQRAVVVLDDCEHLLESCARQVRSIESSCPGVAILATSREPIRTPGETVWHIDPLELPSGHHLPPEDLLETSSGRLFAERAEAARSEFRVDESNVDTVAEITRRLDGLPLAIELAAALIAVQSPAEILEGLDDRFRILRSRSAAESSRHGSIEGLLAWSYEALDEDERKAFRCLSVFSSGFGIETAAVAVGHRADARDVAPIVWSLVDRSLIQPDLTAETTRYRLLDTMRSYGRELLDEKDETGDVAVRLSDHYLTRLGPWLPPDRSWAGQVAQEIENLRGLILLLPSSTQEKAQQIACVLGRYQGDALHRYVDGIEEVERHVRTLPERTPTRVSLLTTLAFLHLRGGDVNTATRLVSEAAQLRDEVGVPEWDEVAVDRARGEIARRSGDFEAAVEIAREALERPLTDRSRSRMYNLLGTSAGGLGDLDAAKEAFAQELELNRSLSYEAYVASALGNLAEVAWRQGDFAGAARYQLECLDHAVALGSVTVLAFSMIMAARLAGRGEEWEMAVRLHAKGEQLLAETGLVLYEDDRRESDELLDAARIEIGDERYETLERAGFGMEMDEVIDRTRSQLAGTVG